MLLKGKQIRRLIILKMQKINKILKIKTLPILSKAVNLFKANYLQKKNISLKKIEDLKLLSLNFKSTQIIK
jgi:hypothetical protein